MMAAGLLGALTAVLVTAAPDLESTARATAEQSGKAVVTIRLVLKLKSGGQEHEQKMEAPGVVIDPAGLTVASASSIDPSGAFRRMVDAQRQRLSIESEVKEPVILLEDGTELEAAVVLKDTDLDLAFIRPRDPGLKLAAVNLKPRSGTVPLLTRIYVLGRLSKLANRALSVATGEVRAYGAPLGLFVKRFATTIDTSSGRGSDSVMTVLRPVDKLLELADQARKMPVNPPESGVGVLK